MGPEEVRPGINYVSSNSVCIKFLSVTVLINSVSIKDCLIVASLLSETDKLGFQGFRYFSSAQLVRASILAAFVHMLCLVQGKDRWNVQRNFVRFLYPETLDDI